MKKLVILALVAVNIYSGKELFAACLADSGICWGSGQTTIASPVISSPVLGLPSYTLTQVNSLTPTAAGQLVYVSNGVNSAVCVSSGTGTGAFVASSSPTVHCDVR